MKKFASIILMCYSFMLFAQDGLVGEYYNGTNFEQKVLTRVDPKIDFGWWHESPAAGVDRSYFSVRWTGWLIAPETGKYLFSAKVDDGIRLWVNDVPMINAWDLNNMGEFSNTITLQAGKSYFIKVEYFNAMREGEITLLWQVPSMVNSPNFAYSNFKPVPANQYTQTKTESNPPVIASKTTMPKPKPQPATPSVKKEKIAVKPVSTYEKMDKDLAIRQVFFIKSMDKMTDNSIERLDKVVLFLRQ